MSINKRQIIYQEAISEALRQAMAKDKNVFVMGLGVRDYKGIFGTTTDIAEKYGPRRVIETPASENALTGIAIGAASQGKRPVIIHARNDFMFLTLDQMINGAAKWKYMYGGKSKAPFLVRGVIGKGWGQGPTHSQSIQSVFLHFPGIYLAMPSTPYDVKGMILEALSLDVPVVILEHRALYNTTGYVPSKPYTVDFGKARIVRRGRDITIIAVSIMVQEAVRAAMALERAGVQAEVIDPRSLNPLDMRTIISSAERTGNVIVADTSWAAYGFCDHISSEVSERAHGALKNPVCRIGLPECPSPVSKKLEDAYYPNYKTIYLKACSMLKKKAEKSVLDDPVIDNFKGPY